MGEKVGVYFRSFFVVAQLCLTGITRDVQVTHGLWVMGQLNTD